MAFVAMVAAGCSSTLKATSVDASTGRFATGSSVKQEEILVQEAFRAEYEDLLFVKTSVDLTDYNDFFMKSFKQMKPYRTVLNQSELEALVIERNLTDKVSSISDLVGLNRLSREIGPILVVEPKVEFGGGYNFSATLKATDATTGKTVFEVRRKAFNWAGLDKPLFYPILNAFADWSEGKPVTVAAESKKK